MIEWASAAFEVRAQYPGGGPSVGIPTWLDGLLARCTAGVVFLPGAAGTVQEIFDNSTPNYYESRGEPRPMVLVDRIEDAPEALKRAGN